MSTEQNEQLIQRWKDEAWNKRNLRIIDELYGPDYLVFCFGDSLTK